MDREILRFRTWDGLNKKFTYWTLNDLCTWDTKDEKPSALDEWEQYTGLKDKNGVEIYEGDVLNFNNYSMGNNNTPEGKLVFLVKWEDQIGCGCCGYGTGYDFEAHNNIEVIGNIHQNPDLLNS